MSLGSILALLVLIVAVVALVFSTAMPGWLPLVLTAGLALAILTGGYTVPLRPA